jgi:uncharacterized membrane protein YphA (DoxX/SURF4 family)
VLLRHVARPLLAAPFVYDGLSAALRPAAHVDAAAAAADEVAAIVPTAPRVSRTQLGILVRVHGVLTAAAGVCLALHKAPRLAALALAVLTAPLAVANEPFTSHGAARTERAPRFIRNLGAMGAALIAAADHEGKPGMRYRVARARQERAAVHAARAQGAAGTAGTA